MAKEKENTSKTFVVRKTYEFRVEACSRDEAVGMAEGMIPENEENLISTKVGTCAQMRVPE